MSIRNKFIQIFSSPIFILSIVTIILFAGNLFEIENPYSDPLIFQCYTIGFWHGKITTIQNAKKFPLCKKLIEYYPTYFPAQPFHTVPREYPLLSLLPFSLPLLFPIGSYQMIFGCFMLLISIVFYLYLLKYVSKKSGLLFLFLLLLGTVRTGATRFDIIPAIATFFCLLATDKKKILLAYVLLAIAIFTKFYPLLLFFPLFIAEQQSFDSKTPFFRRISNTLFFGIICAGFISISYLINSRSTFSFLYFYLLRPFEFESVGANVIALLSMTKQASFCLFSTYGSVNIFEEMHGGRLCRILPGLSYALTDSLGVIFPAIFFLGIFLVIKMQKNAKIPLSWSFIAIILLMLVTGKVLSPQFLIWLIPLIVYVQGYNRIWLGLWISISLLTTLEYPTLINLYFRSLLNHRNTFFWENLYFFVLTIRNGLLILLTIYHIFVLRTSERETALEINHP